MKPEVEEKGRFEVRRLARVSCLSSVLFQGREIWCISFNLYPSKPPIIYIILLNIIDLWKVLGCGDSPDVSILTHLRKSISN
jgi:hypothetical protein